MNQIDQISCLNCACNMGRFGRPDYTIEEHLKQFRDDEHYKILYDSWSLEKREYENRLKVVGMRYQTYSQHDATHSEAILRQLTCFLGEDRIRQLSPTDTWLLLECAYCHDLGMVVTAKEVFDIFSAEDEKDFKELSEQMYQSENIEMKQAWSYLEPLFRYSKELKTKKDIEEWGEGEDGSIEKYKNIDSLKKIFDSEWYKWPLYFTQAFMMITQEYFRPKHAEMSYAKIVDEADMKEYEGIIPLRLRYLVAEIARVHTADRMAVVEKLTHKVQGIFVDSAHPRFIAELLRIGDLLDMDNNRFSKYQLAVAGNPSYNSFAHQLKHKSLRDFLVTPQKVIVHADFKISDAKDLLSKEGMYKIFTKQPEEMTEDKLKDNSVKLAVRAFKEMSGWLDMLRKELDFFSVKWFDIIPEGFLGSCSIFEEEKLLIDGVEVDAKLLNLRYQIAPKRASQIIEGASLYSNPFQAFLREILQNSMDAVKRQIYANIQKDHVNKDAIGNPLDFYRYIAKDMQQLQIEIEYEYLRDNGIQLKIRDRGIGISYARLQDMQYIGDMLDYKSKEQDDQMPPWWKPTGSFGIGMQTIFYFTKIFDLRTRNETENVLRKMAFHSTQAGGKIDTYFVNDAIEAENFGYGTEIKVQISYDIMKAAQEKGFFDTDLDYFGKKKDYYKEEVYRISNEIRGYFGLPVAFHVAQRDKEPEKVGQEVEAQKKDVGSGSRFLRTCFGEFFVDIKTGQAQMVVKGTENQKTAYEEEKYRGFSCWDEENKILIRYKPLDKRKRSSIMKIYFNEILVDSYPLTKMFHIDFWETEVYLFSNHADNFIEINREGFLKEKQRYISGKICDTHLKCIRILLCDSLDPEYGRIVWTEGFYGDVKKYYEFLLLGSKLMPVDIGIRIYIREHRMLSYITTRELEHIYERNSDIDSDDKVWLIDMGHRFIGDIRLKQTYEKVGYIVEDILCGYQSMAVCEMEVLEDLYGGRMILYKTAVRSGMPIKISEDSVRQYILHKFLIDKSNRLILPGMEEYKDIRIVKLIGSLGTDFEKRFDSAVIFPLSIPEFKSLLEGNKELTDVERYIEEEVLDKENLVFSRIVDYIKRYGCNYGGAFDPEKIKKKYKELIIYVWKVIKEAKII